MPESNEIKYHIPRSDSPEEVLSAFANSMTLRDYLNSMEATADLLVMVEELEDDMRRKNLEEFSKRLKRQVSHIKQMLKEMTDYLQVREIVDNGTNDT